MTNDTNAPAPDDIKQLKIAVEQSPILKSLMEAAPEAMHNALKNEFHKAGTVLFREGEPGARVYAIWSGRLRVQLDKDAAEPIILRDCFPGDIVGEISLMDNQPRSATVLVMDDSQLISLSKEDFEQVVTHNPAVMLTILKTMSYRLRTSSDRLEATYRSTNQIAERLFQMQEEKVTEEKLAPLPSHQMWLGLSNLAFDINEMARAAIDGIDHVKDMLPDEEELDQARDMLELSKSRVGRIGKTMNFIDHYVQIQTGQIKPRRERINLGVAFERNAARLTPLAREYGTWFGIETSDDLSSLYGDPDLLDDMIAHLLMNAIRVTESGQPIEIEIRNLGEHSINVQITDSGPGIDPAIREYIFEPFVTDNSEGSGSGLGLAYSRAIVEAHDGKIWVEDASGNRGSRFFITLPTGV